MASILLLPPRFTDQRIWGDMPSGLASRFDVISCDWHLSRPLGDAAFLDAARGLAPEAGYFDVAAAAQDAAGYAVDLALAGLVKGLVLFQPPADSTAVLQEVAGAIDLSRLGERIRLFAPLAAAVPGSDAGTWRDMLVAAVRQMVQADLAPADVDLVCQVAADHAGQMRAEVANLASPAGPSQPQASAASWNERLAAVGVPVVIVTSHGWRPAGAALAARAPHGDLVVADAESGHVWLEDRGTALAAVLDVADRCSRQ